MTTAPTRLVLQQRDLQLLSCLGEHGVLDTDMIHARFFAGVSLRRCQQRLALLEKQGLTRTVPLTLWSADASGCSVPTVHSLTERGVEAVEAMTGHRPARVSRGDPKPETIHHRLQIVRTKLTIDDACRSLNLACPTWILEQDRDHSASDKLPPSHRRILYHAFLGPPKTTCQPDAVCRMSVPRDLSNPAAGTSDLIGFFEIDCSSEGRKQIAGKLPGYAALISQRTFQRYFQKSEQAIIRLFWVCHTWERIHSLCERLKDDPVAPYCRFTTARDLTPPTALTSPIWHATDGKRREIIRLPNR